MEKMRGLPGRGVERGAGSRPVVLRVWGWARGGVPEQGAP